MTKYYSHKDYPDYSTRPKRGGKGFKTLLKVTLISLGGLIVLAACGLWIFVSYMNPERICRLIEEEAPQYLDADIKIGNLDYHIFRSYPWLQFEADSITVISESLKNLNRETRDSLPEDADFMASVVKLKGKINLHSLIHDKIEIKDIEIEKPRVNIVMVNDTVANYNIVSRLPAIKKVPKIDLSEVEVKSPVDFSFFSLPYDLSAHVEVDSFCLTRSKDNNYNIGFAGKVSGRWKEYEIPDRIPLSFDSNIGFRQEELTARLEDLTLKIAGVSIRFSGDIEAGQNGVELKEGKATLAIEDLFDLKSNLPLPLQEMVAIPEGLSGKIPVSVALELLSPYYVNIGDTTSFDINTLPAFEALLSINDASLFFKPPKGKEVSAEDIYLEALLSFNPAREDKAALDLKEIRMHGEGISLNGNLQIDNLTGEKQKFNGELSFSSPLMESLSYLVPGSGMRIAGLLKGNVDFSGAMNQLGERGFKNILISGYLSTGALNINSSATGSLHFGNLQTNYTALLPSYPLTDYSGTQIDLEISADSIVSNSNTGKILFADFDFTLDAMDTVSGNPDPYGDFALSTGRFQFKAPAANIETQGVQLKGHGIMKNGGGSFGGSEVTSTPLSGNEAIIAARTAHTPLELSYAGNGGFLQTIMNMISLSADMKIGKGVFSTPSYILPVEFNGINTFTDFNDIRFNAEKIKLGRTSFSTSMQMKGLEPFLTTYSPTPLRISAEINFDDVDINQLSWGYYGALISQGKDIVYYVAPMTPFTAQDSTCIAIPRNINAQVRLKSRSAQYMGYNFSPLSTDIIVNNGVATLKALTVGTPYCTAIVDWTYSTTRLDDIFMDLKADLKNFSFAPFYKVFPDLLAKAPELNNFTGLINADIGCNFKMFPDMFMMGESLKGKFDIKATDMEFARQGKIERITHLMLIEGDKPIKIQNMDIRGGYHDNLLQIDPFKIGFDDYELMIGGINNTSGTMYYHFALEKSPFHLPFGVSVFGKFSHPEIRVGGTRIDDYKAEELSEDAAGNINANIMAYLKHGWLLFIQEAAKYEGKKLKE